MLSFLLLKSALLLFNFRKTKNLVYNYLQFLSLKLALSFSLLSFPEMFTNIHTGLWIRIHFWPIRIQLLF